jgi:hypothetical protein
MPYNFWNSEILPSKSLIHQHRQRFCPVGAGFVPAFLLLPTLSPDGAIMGYALPKYRAFGGISAALLSALCSPMHYALCSLLLAPCGSMPYALCPMPTTPPLSKSPASCQYSPSRPGSPVQAESPPAFHTSSPHRVFASCCASCADIHYTHRYCLVAPE